MTFLSVAPTIIIKERLQDKSDAYHGKKIDCVYLHTALTLLGCAPIQQTDTHADLPMMSMILLFPAAGLVSCTSSWPLNIILFLTGLKGFSVLIPAASSMQEIQSR